MQNPTVVADYTDRHPETTAATQKRLDAAWRALVSEVPSLPTSITAGSVDVELVKDIVSTATARVLRNPEGYTSGSGSLDDYREEWERKDQSIDLYFTAAELRRLGSSSPTLGAGSLKYS